ncbi:MAG TPA: IS66 family insertion sequence element accessory protein TnpB [Thermoanaerobaculia bacterium]|nr:IS66 family insertion sequence element accessory protein TnpB [Thermoanaerobaculia bacterium]
MILTHSLKVCLAVEPCDLRKSFDSLSAVVRNQLAADPLSRTVYVFLNKARDRIKLLYWDGSGLWVMAKRLEKGRFSRPDGLAATGGKIRLRPEALEMLLSGIELRDGMRRAWYETPGSSVE